MDGSFRETGFFDGAGQCRGGEAEDKDDRVLHDDDDDALF
jgi:hypothetical protein